MKNKRDVVAITKQRMKIDDRDDGGRSDEQEIARGSDEHGRAEDRTITDVWMITKITKVRVVLTIRRKRAREERDQEVTDVKVTCASQSQGLLKEKSE